MASNALPTTRDRLFTLCNSLCDGLHSLETSIGIKQNTEAILRAAYAASMASEVAYAEALAARKAAYAALSVADESAKVFLSNTRRRLAKFLGESSSIEWTAAGWPSGSTSQPRRQDDRYILVNLVRAYFVNHPEHESVEMETTAALAEALFTTLTNARALVQTRISQAGEARNARDVAEANLRRRANGLVGELETLLSTDDERWHRFGLNRPADEETPEAPDLITVSAGATPGMLLVQWNDSPRADYYRVWKQGIGTDTGFSAVQSPADSNAILTGLPSGATIKVRITAINSAGESAPSAEAEAVVP